MDPTPSLFARARRSFQHRGLGRTLRVGWAWAAYHWRHGARAPRRHAFDLEYGLDTTSIHRAEDLAPGCALVTGEHEPVDPVDFHRLLTAAPLPWRDLTFVDIGSGQGRALLLASDYPFRRILGVEVSRALHQSACANIALYQSPRQQCPEITSVWADAATWAPPDEDCAFYLYDPFDEALMRTLLSHLLAWRRCGGRHAFLLYLGARYLDLLARSSGLDCVAAGSAHAVYRLTGDAP